MAYENLQGDIGSSSGQYVKMATSGTASVLALTTSKVGIGTTSPAQALAVVGAIRTHLSTNNSYRSDHYVGMDNNGHINAYDDNGAVYLPLYLDGASLILNWASGGKVGLGVTAPDTKLHVNGSITIGAAGAPQIISGTGAPSDTSPNGSLYLRTDAGTHSYLYVRENGSWVGK